MFIGSVFEMLAFWLLLFAVLGLIPAVQRLLLSEEDGK